MCATRRIVMLHMEIARTPRYRGPACLGRNAAARMSTPCARASASWKHPTCARHCAARASADCVHRRGLTYFLGWHLVRARPATGLAGFKSRLFAYMQRRSAQAAEFFRMPTAGRDRPGHRHRALAAGGTDGEQEIDGYDYQRRMGSAIEHVGLEQRPRTESQAARSSNSCPLERCTRASRTCPSISTRARTCTVPVARARLAANG